MLLSKSRIIVTGGPTREWFDPIRYISNASSGKMGIALADRAYKISSDTLFIHGPIDASLLKGKGFRCLPVESTNDLLEAVLSEICENSVLIMCAAPADYTPVERSHEKIKKQDGEMVIRMKRTPDVLKNVAAEREKRGLADFFVTGFAAETTDTENYARLKLKEKNLDMICLNDVSREGAGFGVDTNIMTLFTRTGLRVELPMLTKDETAAEILKMIEAELLKRG